MEVLIVLVVLVPIIAFMYKQSLDTKKLLENKKSYSYTEEEAIEKASAKAKAILLKAEKQSLEVVAEGEKKALEMRRKAEDEVSRDKSKISQEMKKLDEREKMIIQRSDNLNKMFAELEQKEKSLEQAKKDVKRRKDDIGKELEKIAQMTKKDAQDSIMKMVEEENSKHIAKSIREAENKIQKSVDEKAKDLLVNVMQHSATDYVAEATSTTMEISSEEMKGKIIGKEGRNIRTFERLTGVDIIVDEAPNQITLSCFDPIRREVAAIALERLLADGRVHPGSIEEMVIKVKNQLAKEIQNTGEKIASEAGFENLPQEVILLLGRFKYRFSYGQNLAKHSLEMVNIGEQLAAEIGADINFTKLACLLHDVGKVLVHEQEGKPHHHISGDVVRRYFKDEKLANAVESHHGDIETKSIEAHLVQIADAISGARPGARRNSHEDYVKRIRALEDIAKQYQQVEEAFAIHAGREVRVIINPNNASDDETQILAQKIAKEIEKTQNYPGTVKVTAIREYRIQEEAK